MYADMVVLAVGKVPEMIEYQVVLHPTYLEFPSKGECMVAIK